MEMAGGDGGALQLQTAERDRKILGVDGVCGSDGSRGDLIVGFRLPEEKAYI